jgi:polypyrimidine tract-binding protein 1
MNATEQDLLALASPFGQVQNLLLLAHKRQAFIQMDSVDNATKVVQNYMANQAYIQSQPVYFQFSNRTEVTGNTRYSSNLFGTSTAATTTETKVQEGTSPVLLVSILNARLQVTIDNLHTVFSSYGTVQRIITFQKPNQGFKALVEMARLDQAMAAKKNLEGKDMFQDPYSQAGCCTLKIDLSSTPAPLKVKSNDPNSKDYASHTQHAHTLISFGNTAHQSPLYGGSFGGQSALVPSAPKQMTPASNSNMPGCVILVNNLAEDKFTPENLFTLFGVYGDVMRVKILYNKKSTAMIQFAAPAQAQMAIQCLNNLELHGKTLVVTSSKHNEVALPNATMMAKDEGQLTKDFTASKLHRFKLGAASKNARHIVPPTNALHISALPSDVTDSELKKLFEENLEQKGEVEVKIFGKDKEKQMAIITLASIQAAVMALIRLHNYHLRNKYLRVTFAQKSDQHKQGQQQQQQQQIAVQQMIADPAHHSAPIASYSATPAFDYSMQASIPMQAMAAAYPMQQMPMQQFQSQ